MQTWALVNGQLHNGSGPQLSKESVKSAMKGAKRVIEMGPNMIFNEELVNHYHKVETATDSKSELNFRGPSNNSPRTPPGENIILHGVIFVP